MSDGTPLALDARSASLTVVAQIVIRAFTMSVLIGATAIVTRTLPVAVYADWATVLSLVVLVSIALDAGLTPVVIRRLAQAPADLPTPRALLRLRMMSALVALLVVVGLSALLRGADAAVIGVALGAQLLPRAAIVNVAAFLQADHRVHRQTAYEAGTTAVGLAALAIAALAGAPAAVLALVGISIPACALAVILQSELHKTPSSKLVVPGDDRARLRSTILEFAPLAGALVLTTLYTRLHVVFVNAVEDAAGVAQFLLAFQFIEQIVVLAGIFAGALLPLLAVKAAAGNALADRGAQTTIIAMAAVGALISAGLMTLAEPLRIAVGGPKLAGAEEYLRLLSPMGAVLFAAFSLGYLLTAVQLGRRYLWINCIALALNVAAHATWTLSAGAEAAARIAWMTEGLVVALAFIPVWRAGGREPGIRLAVLVGACVLAAEAATARWIPPAAAGVGLAAAVLLLCRRELWAVVNQALKRA
jgi:O-antigen/teichoic acid export membrane protein